MEFLSEISSSGARHSDKKATATGTVQVVSPLKRLRPYPAPGGREIVVHLSTMQIAGLTDLRKGQKVSFEIFDDQGKPAAKNLHIYDGALGNPSEDKVISAGAAQNARYKISLKSTEKVEGNRKPITQYAVEAALAQAVRAHDTKCKKWGWRRYNPMAG